MTDPHHTLTDSWYRHPGDDTTRGLHDLWKHCAIQNPRLIVEVGSADGGSAAIWATLAPGATVLCIDPWEDGSGYGEDVFRAFLKRRERYPNIAYRRMTSEDAFRGLRNCRWNYDWHKTYEATRENEFVDVGPFRPDLVYLDADHTYDGTLVEIERWRFAVRDAGGWIGGHDYSDQFPGVIRAVSDWFEEPEVFCDTSWVAKA